MNKRNIEIWVGIFVTAGIAALVMLAMQVSNLNSMSSGDTYEVMAEFQNIGGLNVRSPVRASGVLVGRVSKISYNNDDYMAIATLSIDKRFDQFSIDSSASIYTAGLLGEQYIGLTPGFEDQLLADGDKITDTDSAVILEKMIGQFLVNKITD